MTQWEFEILRFGKVLTDFVISEGATEAEARVAAKKYLGRGETLGKLISMKVPA